MADEAAGVTEDLPSRILRLRAGMPTAVRQVADLVLADPEFAVRSHTNEIAARAGVAASSVTRFCRTVGCGGLRELKLDLARTLAVGDRYLHPRPVRLGTSEAVREILAQIHRSLDCIVEQVDDAGVKRAAAAIAGAERVVVFGGGGGSSMAAMEAENRLFRLGLHVSACNDSQLQLMMAATLRTGDTLLALSMTGNYPPMARAAEVARKYGAKVIAVTAPESPLAAAATDIVTFRVAEPDGIFTPTPARYVLLALIDILAYEAAKLREVASAEPLRRIKYQLVHARDKDDTKPLGD